MPWTYHAYRWPSEAAYLAALAALGWQDAPPPEVALLPSGTLHGPPPDDETPGGALPGYHVAAAFRGVSAPEGWRTLEIDPPESMPVLGRPPAPTLESYRLAVMAHADSVAEQRGYDNAASCAGYVASTVPAWATEAAAFIAWRDAVWVAVFDRLAEVQGGAAAPSIYGLIAGLPAIEWPA